MHFQVLYTCSLHKSSYARSPCYNINHPEPVIIKLIVTPGLTLLHLYAIILVLLEQLIFSSTVTINYSSAGTFLHLNAISTVPDRCYPIKVQTSNEQNQQDISFYTLLIFSSAGTFNFSSPGTINFSSTLTFNFSSAGTFNFSSTVTINFTSAGTFNFSSAGTFDFSSAGTINFNFAATFLHLNAIRTISDRCYPFKVQTSNEQNLQDIPFSVNFF